jgi:Kef-type K+ transport system membrane component KefB
MDNPQEKPVSVGDWVLTLIVLGVPLLNLFFLFYWALSDSTARSKKNYCRACLLFFAIGLIVSLLFLFAFGGLALLAGARL